jgi:chromosome segregation ATPase
MKTMSSSLEILRKEKIFSENEINKVKDKLCDYQRQIDLYSNGKQLSNENKELQSQLTASNQKISSLQGELLLKKATIDELNQKLEIAHFALNIQDNYENSIFYDSQQGIGGGGAVTGGGGKRERGSSSVPSSSQTKTNLSLSFGKNREILKKLYFDLSKKTVNNQAMTEELLSLSKEKTSLSQQLSLLKTGYQQLEERNEILFQEFHEKEELIKSRDREILENLGNLEKMNDFAGKLGKQIEELNRRLTETFLTNEKSLQENQFTINAIQQEKSVLTRELETLLRKSTSLQQQNENLSKQQTSFLEKMSSLEDLILFQEKKLQETISQLELVNSSNADIKQLLEKKEVEYQTLVKNYQTLENEKYEMKAHVTYLTTNLKKEKDLSLQWKGSSFSFFLLFHFSPRVFYLTLSLANSRKLSPT